MHLLSQQHSTIQTFRLIFEIIKEQPVFVPGLFAELHLSKELWKISQSSQLERCNWWICLGSSQRSTPVPQLWLVITWKESVVSVPPGTCHLKEMSL